MKPLSDLRRRLSNGEPAWGTFLSEMQEPGVPHILALEGMSFFVIDAEHGMYDSQQIARLIEAARQSGIAALVRAPGIDRGFVTRVLDAGAAGIVFPVVSTPAQAREAVQISKYPPVGQRGVHRFRPHTGYVPPSDYAAFFARSNASLLTVVQIETRAGVESADSIAAIEGIDALYVGPSDLSTDIGCPGQFTDARLQDSLRIVAKVCQTHGKIAAIQSPGLPDMPSLFAMGYTMISWGSDLNLLALGIRDFLAHTQTVQRSAQPATQ